jgi:sigma-E factor negative regulatory protein RseB
MPRALRSSARLASLALVCAVSGAALAEEPAPNGSSAPSPAPKLSSEHTPAEWLERMNTALNTRNYDGTFAHWHGGRVEMLRIIHRLQDGVVSERLASLDGSGREFIRTGSSLTCYLPDKRTVLVEQRPAEQSLVGFPTVTGQTANFYEIREVGHTRLNRRDTHVIDVAPKDEFRYGYRLWIDDSTAMPVKSQLADAHGRVIEQIVFASLTVSARLSDALFKPEVSTDGFQWLRNDAVPQPPAAAAVAWGAVRLPPGFRMSVRSAQMLPGSSSPVDHLVFTDGFASVSVFVEAQPAAAGDATVVTQSATVGSSSAFSTTANGQKITAVGEVPLATVEYIASQVKAAQGVQPTVRARGR